MTLRAWSVGCVLLVLGCSDQAPRGFTCGLSRIDAECHAGTFDGTTREYLLHVPTTFRQGTSALVIGLHGVGQYPADFRDATGLNAKSDEAGFAIAYPLATVPPSESVPRWNAYFTPVFNPNPPDDVAFIRGLIRQLSDQLHPSPKRVYVTGISNGGLMAHRVGVELGDVVAAIGVVSGTLASVQSFGAVPDVLSPVSVLILHGDQDDQVQCCALKFPATQDQTFDYWAGPRGNQCTTLSTTQPICDAPETPSETLSEKRATGCASSTEVRFYMLRGGAHHWYTSPMNVPGQTPYNPMLDATTGVTTNDILWRFFESHPKP